MEMDIPSPPPLSHIVSTYLFFISIVIFFIIPLFPTTYWLYAHIHAPSSP
jgi:hypothetical protein